MSTKETTNDHSKQFGPTTWSIKNKTSIYLLMLFVSLAGIYQFMTLPKEQFPDIVIPTIYIQTINVGNSPRDIENLVTAPIEKQIKSITGAKIVKTTSTSLQDFSAIMVEFGTDVSVDVALQKVKDAVDKAKTDLPTDLTVEPAVQEVSFSEQPIMYVNVSGNYDAARLKRYAEALEDRFENLSQLNRVDIVGAPEREFQINVDNLRMEASGVTYDDIARAVQYENMDISGGQLEVGNTKRNLQLKGQFKTAYDLEKVVVRNATGSAIYLKDIAEIRDTVKENESFARLDNKNVLTLNIIKRAGENLIETSDDVHRIVEEMRADGSLPKPLDVRITGDQSVQTRTSFKELVNSIVIGFLLVLLILMFFMGVTNAFFVALSVPLSMFVAFLFLPAADLIVGAHVTLNFMVLFALLFGLGIIVDDAIVVIENTHRIHVEGKGSISPENAAKAAAGEVWIPVLAGTLTTLAPFVPLLFWPGIIGKFMVYLPTMLIFTLTASLIVAFIMNPVFAVDFMNEDHHNDKPQRKSDIFRKPAFWIAAAVGVLLNVVGFMSREGSTYHFFGNLILFMVIMVVFHRYLLERWILSFQNRVLPAIMNSYERSLHWALDGRKPVWLLLGTIGLFIVSFAAIFVAVDKRRVGIEFFPSGDPNQVYVYLKLPSGTDIDYTDSITRTLETKVYRVLGMESGKKNPLVESVISNVAVGASDPASGDRSTRPELGRVQVSFVEFEKRHGKSTKVYMDSIRAALKGIPGAEISVAQESGGPPTDPPVNIEVSSEDFDKLTKSAVALKNYLDSIQVAGVEELKMDVDLQNPEVTLTVDRERALIEGVSSAQIGMAIRTGLFGREVSKIKEGEDEYKIQLRNQKGQRRTISDLLNMNIAFRDMASGQIKSIPISSLVKVDYTSTYGSVKRKNQKRVITLRSNVLTGYTPNDVNPVIAQHIADFKKKPEGVTIAQTGEGEQQAETGNFLVGAMVIALGLILFILVLQFNSISKSIIILMEILFSVIGVLLGFALTGMTLSIVMTGIGIVGLAGIVVKNGILVIEFADELRGRGMKTREAVIQAGKTRIIPVLLTAVAAILGLIPLATGFNIDFITLFSELNPHIFFGGDNAMFWKPLSWTIIFGLIIAFFMTLLIVPAMYLIAERLRRPMRNMYGGKWISTGALVLPAVGIGLMIAGVPGIIGALFIFGFPILMIITAFKHRNDVQRRRRKLPKAEATKAWVGSWF